MRRHRDDVPTSAPPWLWVVIATGLLVIAGLWWWAS